MVEEKDSLSITVFEHNASLTSKLGAALARIDEIHAGLEIHELYRQFLNAPDTGLYMEYSSNVRLDPAFKGSAEPGSRLGHLQSIATLGQRAPDLAAHILFHLGTHPVQDVAFEATDLLQRFTSFGTELIQTMLVRTAKPTGMLDGPADKLIDTQTEAELVDYMQRFSASPKSTAASMVYNSIAHQGKALDLTIAFLCRADMREASLEVLELAMTSDNPALRDFATRALEVLNSACLTVADKGITIAVNGEPDFVLTPEALAKLAAASLEVLGDEPKSTDHVSSQPRGAANIGGGSVSVDTTLSEFWVPGHAHHKRMPPQFVTVVAPRVHQHHGQRRRIPL